jgi:hypothetical protein
MSGSPHFRLSLPFIMTPLTWFNIPAPSVRKTEVDRQTQFGRQRFLKEPMPDRVVRYTHLWLPSV